MSFKASEEEEEVPIPYDNNLRERYHYADLIQCDTCTDGYLVWGKNGWICEHCDQACCESCCDAGDVIEENFICLACVREIMK